MQCGNFCYSVDLWPLASCGLSPTVLISNWRVISFFWPGSQMPHAKNKNTINNKKRTVNKQAPVVGSWNCIMKLPEDDGFGKGPLILVWNETRCTWIDPAQASAPSPLRLLLRGAPASVLLPEEPESLKIRLKGLRLLGAFNFKNVLKWRNIQLWGANVTLKFCDGPASMKNFKGLLIAGFLFGLLFVLKQTCMCLTMYVENGT